MPAFFLNGFDLRQKPKTTRLFLAEGLSEVGFLESALALRGADDNLVTILCFQGIDRMAAHARSIVKFIAPEVLEKLVGIGLIADSESDPSARLAAIIDCAKAFSFPKCAADLLATGKHVDGDRKFAASLSPALSKQGRIETLILDEISPTATMQCILASLPCIVAANNQRSVDQKAQVQMYISAAINNSMAGIRQAFLASLFKVTHPTYATHLTMVDFVLA
jgi:hypothetical protein